MDLKAEADHQEVVSDKSSGGENEAVQSNDGLNIDLGGIDERKLVRKLDFQCVGFPIQSIVFDELL